MKTKLKFSLIISLIANVDSIFSLISRTSNILKTMNAGWILHIISILGVFIIAYYLLSKYETIRDGMIANNVIAELRNKYFFLKSFEEWEFYKTPHETSEQFFKRIPEGQYYEYLKKEYSEAINILIKEYDKKPSEAEKMIDSLYGFETKKSKD
jgi:hypothetical protein